MMACGRVGGGDGLGQTGEQGVVGAAWLDQRVKLRRDEVDALSDAGLGGVVRGV